MKIQLIQDIAMPAVGFGTYLIDDKQAEVSVTQALKSGCRHIDTAEGYPNEAGVDRAIYSIDSTYFCVRRGQVCGINVNLRDGSNELMKPFVPGFSRATEN